jgi:nucleoside phosphorylase
MLQSNSPKAKGAITKAIVLTSQNEVWQAINTKLENSQEISHSQGTVYQVGNFSDKEVEWEIILVEIESGNTNSAFETERAIREFSPEAVFFIGLAGGIRDIRLGDVVASTKIYGYESGTVTDQEFEWKPEVSNASYGLEQRAKADARSGNWIQRLEEFVDFQIPQAKVSPIAAGEKHIEGKENEIAQFIKRKYSDALAVETEGRGFLEAARANSSLNAIVIRGISYLLEVKESEDKLRAANNAAAFFFEMLSNLRIESKPNVLNRIDISSTSQAEIEINPPSSSKKIQSVKQISLENLYSVLTGNPTPIFWLGGGASVKSGIPLSEDLVEKAVRWNHCLKNGFNFDDLRVQLRLSDWLPDMRKEPWFGSKKFADAYFDVIYHLLPPRENRREFFRAITNPQVPPSLGYEKLAEFIALGFITTVVTTNFDRVLPKLCQTHRRLHQVEIIDNASIYRYLKTNPKYPVITYLYGNIEDYVDRFNKNEKVPLDDKLVSRLIPVLRDHPIIVIGYRGAEEVIMKDLLLEYADELDNFEQGIYWCVQTNSSEIHPFVQELAEAAHGNFQLVSIPGFDEMMNELWTIHQKHKASPVSLVTKIDETDDTPAPKFDLQTIDADADRELDWTNIKARLVTYYEVWEMPRPDVITQDWLKEEMCRQHLAEYALDGKLLPTKAGFLLFGRDPHERIPGSAIILRVEGEDEQYIEGNLWTQLKRVLDALAEVNTSFLLKGEKSETVYPYPPTALREVIVNSLVHRDYSLPGNIIIQIGADYIRITNPGGLVEDVFNQTDEGAILAQIEQGRRGIKGYRNPVIADLFYSSHDMEKKGSGLADVYRLVRDNGGRVNFGPISDNTKFEVIIYSRPEVVDKETGTAAVVVSTRYAANLLEVSSLPEQIWQASTPYTKIKDVWSNTHSMWLPPFILNENKLLTFFDLEDKSNPLRQLIDPEQINLINTKDFSRTNDRRNKLVWLLNECIYKHLKHCGLTVDIRRRRAYFTKHKDIEEKRHITYKARLKKSTRTVTKPVVSSFTQKIRYWEHQSFTFELEQYNGTWAMKILPGYVFTLDGIRDLLEGERVNVLSTKRASRDYNSKVHTDLIFWTWILSNGKQGDFSLQMGPTEYEINKQIEIMPKKKKAEDMRFVNNLRKYTDLKNQPRILINSILPTFTIYSLEQGYEFEAEDNIENDELEEEISALLDEIEDRVEDR